MQGDGALGDQQAQPVLPTGGDSVHQCIQASQKWDLDLQGFLGIRKDVRKGFQNIKVSFKVKSDGDTKLLEQLAKNSPVFDIVTNPVPVDVTVEKK